MLREADIFHNRPAGIVGKVVPSPVGSMNYNVLGCLLEELQILKLNRGAEIGVFQAATSEYLLTHFKTLELFCVDPFIEYTHSEADKTASFMSECEVITRKKLDKFGPRAKIIKDLSILASRNFEEQQLNFVYIDAIHSYDEVLADLNAWYPKVRSGGLVSGHDISWPGVKEAVENFCSQINKAAYMSPSTSDNWFFIK